MKTYEKQILEFGREIADEILKKEKDPSYTAILDRYSVTKSLSTIYDEDLRKTTEDLEDSIKRELRIRRSEA